MQVDSSACYGGCGIVVSWPSYYCIMSNRVVLPAAVVNLVVGVVVKNVVLDQPVIAAGDIDSLRRVVVNLAVANDNVVAVRTEAGAGMVIGLRVDKRRASGVQIPAVPISRPNRLARQRTINGVGVEWHSTT